MIREMMKREESITKFKKEEQLKTSVNNLKEIYLNKLQQKLEKKKDVEEDLTRGQDFILRLQDKSRLELNKQIENIKLKASKRY